MLMTLVLPGSAQLVAGRKKLGRIAMRIWFALVLTVIVFVLWGLTSHTFVINVTDAPPSTPVDIDGATDTVAEGAAINTAVGITARTLSRLFEEIGHHVEKIRRIDLHVTVSD